MPAALEQKQRTREARIDGLNLAVDDDLRVVAVDLRVQRLSISRARFKNGRGRCAVMSFRLESLRTVIFAQVVDSGTVSLEGSVPRTT